MQRIIRNVPAYAVFKPVEISYEECRDKWLVELHRDGMLVGVNWSGENPVGYDLDAPWARMCVESAMQRVETNV